MLNLADEGLVISWISILVLERSIEPRNQVECMNVRLGPRGCGREPTCRKPCGLIKELAGRSANAWSETLHKLAKEHKKEVREPDEAQKY